ncbi:MAG: ATP-binding protein [Nannocystis sp.]|uniref:ATP-binding protein n=1 Tax=Nannocystis sp. TaxID=1962667 RepID=UPI0024242432|nr:ATP-binding protein [Nannocystis sp.]MBK9752960.1 ATP-binding protein [Nannocystis sp.]
MSEVDALLERLVAQFAGPYDFLRELVQNALDAGSDRAEVVLETHTEVGGEADEVVYELRVSDAGGGMDEAVIDGGLTRLFASTKADDRTMAGGYGVGFVSVFAWEPEAVVVHTGRAGEAWELVFYPDRRFEKLRLTEPVEGTTVTLLRRGRASERPAIAEAVRDSLWRWCRYCRLELSFEDIASGEPVELIQDSPAPADTPLTISEVQGDTTVHVAFAVPPSATLLRRGLVLAEGGAAELLGPLLPGLGRTAEHLQVWIDSPLLRTTIARDKVVDDAGQRGVLARAAAAVTGLRARLVAAIEAAAAEAGPWTRARHEHYAHLHAHLGRELEALGAGLRERPLLRDAASEAGLSPAELMTRLRGRPVLTFDPDEVDTGLLAAAGRAGYPVLAAEAGDLGWLMALLAIDAGRVLPLQRALFRERGDAASEGLRAAVERGLLAAGVVVQLRFAAGVPGSTTARPGLVGVEIASDKEGALVVYAAGPWPESAWKAGTLWVEDGMLQRAALKAFVSAPRTAALTLACAVAAGLGRAGSEAGAIAEGLKDLSGGTGS